MIVVVQIWAILWKLKWRVTRFLYLFFLEQISVLTLFSFLKIHWVGYFKITGDRKFGKIENENLNFCGKNLFLYFLKLCAKISKKQFFITKSQKISNFPHHPQNSQTFSNFLKYSKNVLKNALKFSNLPKKSQISQKPTKPQNLSIFSNFLTTQKSLSPQKNLPSCCYDGSGLHCVVLQLLQQLHLRRTPPLQFDFVVVG
jgi:hypothetical protein